MSGRVIVITSGKGGVGKTTSSANIGTALAKTGAKVALIDTDIGLRNLDLLLGLENRIVYTLVDVVEERCKLKQALVKDKKCPNLCLLAAAQTRDKTSVSEDQLKEICEKLQEEFDFVLVDCPAGIEQGFQNAVAGASEAIVVTTPEMSAVRDADRIIGLLEAKEEIKSYKLLINRVRPNMIKTKEMMSVEDVSEILSKGGTILESSRLPSFKEDKVQEQAIHQLKQRGIDGLVVIGGDGSYKGALALSQKGIDCIAIPGTIDNDINGTDETIGFHTALYNIIDAVNKLRDTSSSHHRCFVVEVMGNHADNLAIYSAIACGSEIVITDKTEYDENKIIEELKICEEEYHKKHAIIIVSEKILDVEKLANRISEETGYSGRSIVLGHIQRGGSPVPEDRILASKMAEEAICLLEKRKSGLCICMKDNQIISKNIEEALIEKNENKDRLYQLFLDLA